MLCPAYAASDVLVSTEQAEKDRTVAYEQEFILTAYYSPLPGQCCYIRGSEQADKLLNGEGIRGADGTGVYPGMLAGPPTYKFGTRIVLPGLGTMTVHDRGGAIQEWSEAHRLDVWAGYGEEGLARALAFGVQHIRGTVYPLGTAQPAEVFDLAGLPAPFERIEPFFVAKNDLVDLAIRRGDKSLSVKIVQQALKQGGWFSAETSGMFGQETENAVTAFQRAYGLQADGVFTTLTAAYLQASQSLSDASSPVALITKDSPPSQIQAAQRLLRYLGYYRGRTDGNLSEPLVGAIVKYQQDQKLVADASSPGAGTIGPLTRGKLIEAWRKRVVATKAKKILAIKKVESLLAARGLLVNAFLELGHSGPSVEALQRILVQGGYFPAEKMNGTYGPLTRESVLRYQLAHGLIKNQNDPGAGTIGPLTLKQMRQQIVQNGYLQVKAKGWQSL